MPYTSHGHWFGPGEPTQPEPTLKARCGGPALCSVCKREAMATAHCVREPDGYHAHLYTAHTPGAAQPATIELNLHEWMDEHRQTHPNARDVYAYRRLGLAGIEALGEFDTVEEAWKALGASGEIPPVACTAPDSLKES